MHTFQDRGSNKKGEQQQTHHHRYPTTKREGQKEGTSMETDILMPIFERYIYASSSVFTMFKFHTSYM
jgi:hypothetical protein